MFRIAEVKLLVSSSRESGSVRQKHDGCVGPARNVHCRRLAPSMPPPWWLPQAERFLHPSAYGGYCPPVLPLHHGVQFLRPPPPPPPSMRNPEWEFEVPEVVVVKTSTHARLSA